ncbi:MAG TPA: response regulator transcription factor, partial [Candidatus Hydrogenedentes bacterium]|nr:response regulator transcription factor [Candidatus Hydrogenedentota bacterium]
MSLETKTWRIIVADDHVVVRKGILQVLQSAEDLRVEGEAGSGAELLEQLRKETWDALVLDLHMPGVSGMDLLRQVHAVRPGLPVLILTVQPEDLYARRLLQAGASGYLTKDSVAEELVTALRKVCSGKRYVSETLAE